MHATRGSDAVSDRESDVKTDAERARRYAVDLALRYRSVGATEWHSGHIANLSRSGVLFWTKHLLPVDTPLEMRFVLPLGDTPPAIVCRGRIVRTVLPRGRRAPPGLAATIAAYRFVKGQACDLTGPPVKD